MAPVHDDRLRGRRRPVPCGRAGVSRRVARRRSAVADVHVGADRERATWRCSRNWRARTRWTGRTTSHYRVDPDFLTSELKTAFQIGFLVFIPFLIIDLVVASVLMSMGMMMLSPMLISLPFKIMLFVMVDGWSLLLGTLAGSFFA